MDTLTIASSEVVPDTAGFPHGSLGLADVVDPLQQRQLLQVTMKQ
jgi:hypothetical protein